MTHYENVEMLEDTLRICKGGGTKLTLEQMQACRVYLPEDVEKIVPCGEPDSGRTKEPMDIGCRNTDSFTMALEQNECLRSKGKDGKVLVLNFANPVNPGGGVRRGARAQEEDLCRKSSLLLSLESEEAQKYYRYNRSLNTFMGSDAIILTPDVEIFKDAEGALLEETAVVSVLTCAAPMITYGKEGLSEAAFGEMFYRRICGMLKCAAHWGYDTLVLGAFGCGAFGNDARLVSDLFYKALKEFSFHGMEAESFFRRIDFAVLDRTRSQYNFKEFMRNFEHFYGDEAEQRQMEMLLDAIRGCLLGGAAGDALGYAVEFLGEREIFDRYGKQGITEYELDDETGKALISDDTQMTLFTANGLLAGDTIGFMKGIWGTPRGFAAKAYEDWLYTQRGSFQDRAKRKYHQSSWLCDVPALYARRAPGNTCLSALRQREEEEERDDYIADPINNSKGCGGVMRVAPVAFIDRIEGDKLDMEAAQIAAITHGHSLGYMPAAVLCHIIHAIVYGEKRCLKEIVLEAKEAAERLFAGDEHIRELTELIDCAVSLSENSGEDLENIHLLGEGWVAEETLAIAIYCSLKYEKDFSKGLIASVNHKGDSDSTGAVTGNILGALVGYEAMEEKWKENLECKDVLLEMAEDLCRGCAKSEYDSHRSASWEMKYISMHRRPPVL